MRKAVAVLALAGAMAVGLSAQVRTYPIFTLTQKVTSGTYSSGADRTSISNLSTELNMLADWRDSFTVLYRRTGMEYATGFGYRQNQFLGSYSRLWRAGGGFVWARGDLVYQTANAGPADGSVVAFADIGYESAGSASGIGAGGFYGRYTGAESLGGTLSFWTTLGGGIVLGGRGMVNSLSGDYHDGETLLSGSGSLYFPAGARLGFLIYGSAGKRCLQYDPDLKLAYATTDTLLGSAGATAYLYLTRPFTVFGDVSYESYESLDAVRFSAVYWTVAATLRF
jgi:hypothetical protein